MLAQKAEGGVTCLQTESGTHNSANKERLLKSGAPQAQRSKQWLPRPSHVATWRAARRALVQGGPKDLGKHLSESPDRDNINLERRKTESCSFRKMKDKREHCLLVYCRFLTSCACFKPGFKWQEQPFKSRLKVFI